MKNSSDSSLILSYFPTMLSHTPYGNNSVIHTSYNIKYASSPHNMRSLASRPRIRQPSHLRTIVHKVWKKDRIEVFSSWRIKIDFMFSQKAKGIHTGFNTLCTVPSSHLVFAIGALELLQELSTRRKDLSEDIIKSRRLYMENISGIKGLL